MAPEKKLDRARGQRISDLIEDRGYAVYGGLSRLAREVGVERNQIYRWKAGEGIAFDSLSRLADVLGSTAEFIVSETGPRFVAGEGDRDEPPEHPPGQTARRG